MSHAASLDDDALLSGLESARLPAAAFAHAEHIRAGFLYLTRHPDFGEAAVRFRSALRRFAAANGVPDRYHETVTWAYLALINERAHGSSFGSSAEFLRTHPELLDSKRGAFSRYYDLGAITRSTRARQVFMLPEPGVPPREP
ncbi:MAG: hypothetical protein ACJ79H_16495 [Myxococcales bacterium]